MSELTRGFEEYFPLPWSIETDEDESFFMITPARGSSFLDFGTIKLPKNANVRDILNYMVRCSNLMPEAIEIIKLACFSPCKDLCKYAKNGAPSIDLPECDDCPEGAYYERAKAFLAKLEGRRNRMSDFELLQRIIASRFYIENSDEVKPEDNFKNDLMSDWLGMIELIEDVEHEFSISIPDAEFDKIKTVHDLIECIERAKGGAEDERD